MAKDLTITILEAERMLNFANENSEVKYADMNDYIEKALPDLAKQSHGDIVLTENGIEQKRFKANYQEPKIYKRFVE